MIKIDQNLVISCNKKAESSVRKRTNHNFHEVNEDLIQRLINAVEPYSYIQPHKHENPDKREVFTILSGSVLVVEFDNSGKITDSIVLNFQNGNFGCEIKAKTWHTIIALEPGSALFEVKDGPYNPNEDKIFAPWAPKEGDPDTNSYIDRILRKLELKVSGR
ncbi:MAG: WbuC family cupin fold metalloprotein [Bacteroidetes bacterium]|nr:WbuC family cupin fold metalloprotein [Bacteroidota bacterium]